MPPHLGLDVHGRQRGFIHLGFPCFIPGLPLAHETRKLRRMPNPEAVQSELDFGRGSGAGYARWREEQAAWLASIRRESGLPVGHSP